MGMASSNCFFDRITKSVFLNKRELEVTAAQRRHTRAHSSLSEGSRYSKIDSSSWRTEEKVNALEQKGFRDGVNHKGKSPGKQSKLIGENNLKVH